MLLPDVLNMNGMSFTFSGLRFSRGEYLGGFADRNGNGYLEIAVDTDGGGSCGAQNLYLLEIRSDDEIVSLTSEIHSEGGVMVRNLLDVNNDGLVELEVMTYAGSPMAYGCHSLMMRSYYGWNGSIYENISYTLDETYYPAIEEYWARLDAGPTCLQPNFSMYQMLIDYLALGRLEEGWLRLQRVLHWEQCTPQLPDIQMNEMVKLVAWVGQYLPPVTPTP